MSNTIGFISLGCAKNRVNSEQMMFLLRDAGYHVTGEVTGVDAVVVNTCGFIESAKEEAIDTILELAEHKDKGDIGALIVAGCLAERHKDVILRQLPEVDAVLGTGSFDDIAGVVGKVLAGDKGTALFGDINAPVSEAGRIISTSPVWAYLKIAEGCDNRCAYCCIPAIRGRQRSRPLEAIVREAGKLAGLGYKELITVAQDITAYGLDLYGGRRLPELLSELGKIDGLLWIRLLYMYPDGFSSTLIDEIANNDKIVKYLDIPIQHISDKILRNMNRRGTGAEIRELFKRLKESIPGVVFRSSIITGLPGEGDDEFKELCGFLHEAKIQRAGVFAYSPEEGTPAALMARPGADIAAQRAGIVQDIQSRIMIDYNRGRIGSATDVLIEGFGDDGNTLLARSCAEAPEVDGYIRVKAAEGLRVHEFVRVRLTGTEDGELTGEWLGDRLYEHS